MKQEKINKMFLSGQSLVTGAQLGAKSNCKHVWINHPRNYDKQVCQLCGKVRKRFK